MRYLSLIALFLVSSAVGSSDDERGPNVDVDVDTNVVTGPTNVNTGPTTVNAGDVAVGIDSKNYVFAHSLGDVDIAQCLASTQWGTFLFSKQKVVLNKWCAAEVYDQKGMHHVAALMRCDIAEIAEHFVSEKACLYANTWRVIDAREGSGLPEPTEYFPQEEADKVLVQAEELHTEQTKEFQDFNQRLEQMEAARHRAIVAQREERAYAQSLIERLEEQRKEPDNDPEN